MPRIKIRQSFVYPLNEDLGEGSWFDHAKIPNDGIMPLRSLTKEEQINAAQWILNGSDEPFNLREGIQEAMEKGDQITSYQAKVCDADVEFDQEGQAKITLVAEVTPLPFLLTQLEYGEIQDPREIEIIDSMGTDMEEIYNLCDMEDKLRD